MVATPDDILNWAFIPPQFSWRTFSTTKQKTLSPDWISKSQIPWISCSNSNASSNRTLSCKPHIPLIFFFYSKILKILLWISFLESYSDEVGFVHPTQFATLAEDSTGDAAISDGTTFWCRDHKLGVSTQAVLLLYNAAKRAFIAAMEEYKRLGDGDDGLESEVMKHSKALLLLSSDFGTAWNSRSLIKIQFTYLSFW